MGRDLKVVQCGLGPIGLDIARRILGTDGLKLVGAADVSPDKAGVDLGKLLGLPRRLRIKVDDDLVRLARRTRPDVAVLTTSSSLRDVKAQVAALVERKVDVVSTCEELAYPQRAHASAWRELDRLARRRKVSVLGTGVNPGFAMDALALMLTAPCARVERVAVTRVVDAASRRLPLQRKIGAGLNVHQFQRAVTERSIGHVGLLESAHMITDALGLKPDRFDQTLEPAVAPRDLDTEHIRIPAGAVAGIKQYVRGYRKGVLVVSLDLQMYVGAEEPRDQVRIDGEPPIEMTVAGGIAGDLATAAIAINAIPKVVAAAPGVVTMRDIALVHRINPAEVKALRSR